MFSEVTSQILLHEVILYGLHVLEVTSERHVIYIIELLLIQNGRKYKLIVYLICFGKRTINLQYNHIGQRKYHSMLVYNCIIAKRYVNKNVMNKKSVGATGNSVFGKAEKSRKKIKQRPAKTGVILQKHLITAFRFIDYMTVADLNSQ